MSRAVRPKGVVDPPELVGFADGSLMAYGCAVYVRWKKVKRLADDPDRFYVRLVCGKARVTPLKGTTAPRSEISGFLILTRLLKVVLNAMDVKPARVSLAVDSQCTISALEKTGGLLAPYFASRVSEATSNLSEIAEETDVEPLQHVPGPLNPADLPTRASTLPEEVSDDSVWANGPAYLTLPREHWPFSREFLDTVPDTELRLPRAAFSKLTLKVSKDLLGERLTLVVMTVMECSNCYEKTINVTARLLKCHFDASTDRISDGLTVRDIQAARTIQFIVSMQPTYKALEKGDLMPLRPIVERGIVYVRGRCDSELMSLLGVSRLPVLARETRLARLIMWEAHNEDHHSSAKDSLHDHATEHG